MIYDIFYTTRYSDDNIIDIVTTYLLMILLISNTHFIFTELIPLGFSILQEF